MAEQGVIKARKLWLGGYHLSGYMNTVLLDWQGNPLPNTKLGDDTESNAAGLPSIRTEAAGFWDVDADDAIQNTLAVADTPCSIGMETGAAGEVAYTYKALQGAYSAGDRVGELMRFDVSAMGRGSPLVRGTIMHNATRTSTSTSTAYQVGAASATQTVYAALHVVAASAADTLDVVVQSDNAEGFSSPTTRITFTQATAIGSQWGLVAGAITDDWWRLSYTIGGSDPSFTFVVVLGIV